MICLVFSKQIDVSVKTLLKNRTFSNTLTITEDIKYLVVLAYATFILVSSVFFNTPAQIMQGLFHLTLSPSILLSDYMAIGNIGAAFFNSGLLMIVALVIARINKAHMNGVIIAAIFTIGGFALFGKNIYNIWPIFIGVYLYSTFQKERFSKFILVALFGTALAPLVSQVSFGLDLPRIVSIILGYFLGITAGFILPPLANHVVKFHQGFNLYNIGFTCGIVGTIFMAVFRSFGLENPATFIVSEGYNSILSIYLFSLFASMILLGIVFNNGSFKGFSKLMERSGKLVSDFVISDNFGLSFINMGVLGLISTCYVLILRGNLNGPVIGGIFTVVGFAAFGKHAKNVTPIFIGVFIASFVKVWEVNAAGGLLTALFGTTLAPISGIFGWKFGVLAGFLHISMVANVGYLHGGMNLYNNGFSGGLVAAIMVPIITSLRKVDNDEE